MAELSSVYKFACKWLDAFNNPNIRYYELTDTDMGDDCSALGFKMDCGHAFSEKYIGAFDTTSVLKQIINDVTDIELLGSAVHSKWRYYNHWAYSGSEILDPENKEWFIVVLERLKTLSIAYDDK